MTEKKPWPGDRVINPKFLEHVEHHFENAHVGCIDISRPRFLSSASHEEWRQKWKKHVGSYPPPTFLKADKKTDKLKSAAEPGHSALNEQQFNPHQGNWRLDIEQAHYDRDPMKDDD